MAPTTAPENPQQRSLDLGCGCGAPSLNLFRVGGSQCIEGVDISPEMVAEAEKWRQELGAPVMDGGFLPADFMLLIGKRRTEG